MDEINKKVKVFYCVVPENIHTPPTEGTGNSRHEGGGGGLKDPEGGGSDGGGQRANPFHGGGGYGYFLEPNITKNMERFASNYYEYFPASTLLNAGIAGDTVEAILTILYRVEGMDIPCKVKHIFLLCGMNNLPCHSPATIS